MYNSRVLPYRHCGRAHSPPTWAWYEQLQPEDLESGSEYCSDTNREDDDEEGEYNEDDSDSESEGQIVDVERDRVNQEGSNDADNMHPVEKRITRASVEVNLPSATS